MTMTIQEISDRFEIMDILTDYCTAIDEKRLAILDHVFTHDALIDYSKAGGPKADLQTIKKFLAQNLGDLPRQHMISNFKIQIRGDLAEARCLCHNPLELPSHGDVLEVAFWGLWYNDKLLRTPSGWRIKERVTQPCYSWKVQRVVPE
ncbi:MAG: nuclear transport factor 2 family protein [Verrucomicrobia bacterium]|nr:nuclear transport factor 2 family protein [Verrucomicrobiota bacterium]